MRRPLRLAAAGIALAAAPLALPAAPARAQPADPAARCAALAQAAWPGLEVTATNVVPAAPANTLRMNSVSPDTYPFALPGHCRVEGVVDRRLGAGGDEYGLRFALALPADWNGRLVVTLARRGTYSLLCVKPGHLAEGMRTTIKVR